MTKISSVLFWSSQSYLQCFPNNDSHCDISFWFYLQGLLIAVAMTWGGTACYGDLNCQMTCKCYAKYEHSGCNQKQKMTTDGALSQAVACFLTNTILAHWQTELSPEHRKKAFNTIVWRHLIKWLHAVLYNQSLEEKWVNMKWMLAKISMRALQPLFTSPTKNPIVTVSQKSTNVIQQRIWQ